MKMFRLRSMQFTQQGMDAGLACNPETPVDDIVPYIDKVEMILIMTVHPGFGGQSYIDECTEKVESVNAIVHEYNLKTLIQVDGGVKVDNVCIPVRCRSKCNCCRLSSIWRKCGRKC